MEGLTVDAEGGHGAGFKTWKGDFFFAALADTVEILIHPVEGLIDLLQQALLALLDTHGKVLIGFSGGLIADIRKGFLASSIRQTLTGFPQDRSSLLLQVSSDRRVFLAS